MTDIAALLRTCELALAPEALSALQAGWLLSDFGASDVPELKRIYGARARHLASMDSPHGRQLAQATAELLANLEGATTAQIAFLRGNAEHSFVLVTSNPPERIYGCMKTVSKLDVSPERWAELWGGAV